MMELFDVLTYDGAKTGETKERALVHRDGDWHGSVHIWVIRNHAVLLQKRSPDKDAFPNCYDASCTGHVDSGEDFQTAALRELKEELGITAQPADLSFVTVQRTRDRAQFHGQPFVNNEINYLYVLDERVDCSHITPQASEISSVCWMDLDELEQNLVSQNAQFCIDYPEYLRVTTYLKHQKPLLFTLEPWHPQHIDGVARYANNASIASKLRNVFPHPYTRADAESYVEMCMEHEGQNQLCRAVVVDGEAVGSVGIFVQSDVYEKSGELGYWLGEPFWRRGIMGAAVRQLCEEAFARFSLVRIFAEPYATNTASRRLLESCGFQLEGVMRDAVLKNGVLQDACLYARLRRDE